GRRGGDGAKLAAELGRRAGLELPGVNVGRPAAEPNQDGRARPSGGGRRRPRQVRQTEAAEAPSARGQERPSRNGRPDDLVPGVHGGPRPDNLPSFLRQKTVYPVAAPQKNGAAREGRCPEHSRTLRRRVAKLNSVPKGASHVHDLRPRPAAGAGANDPFLV